MADISAQQVKELRERTGAGMMDCKRALEEAGGDLDEAVEILREQGLATAAEKAGRAADEGRVHAYIHQDGRIGVLVEVNCETDFVARTDEFQELVNNIAMQIAAMAPRYVQREDIPSEDLEARRQLLERQARAEADDRPDPIIEQIVSGRLEKWYSEVCLQDQPYIRDTDMLVGELVKHRIAELGENIRIRRFVRFELGEQEPGSVAYTDSPEQEGPSADGMMN